MRTTSYATLEPFLDERPTRSISEHKYARGMFLTVNNHATRGEEIVWKLKENYKTILYWLTLEKINKKNIKLTAGRPPSNKTLMDMQSVRTPLMVAGIHNYDRYDRNVGRGSLYNTHYQHLHLFLFGIYPYLPSEEVALNQKLEHLKKLLSRHNKRSKVGVKNFIDIRPVGIGKYQYNDIITPLTLHKYLNLPTTEPRKECVINYIADTAGYGGNYYPLSFVYKNK